MQLANLSLHTGSHELSLDQIQKLETPMATETHFPIPHYMLYESAKSALDAAGFDVVHEQHAIANMANRYFGLLQVVRKGAENGVDYARIVGLRNSHDKSFPASAVMGTDVFVCDNLSFFGELRMVRRHTVWILRDLPRLMLDLIAQITDKWLEIDQRYECYKANGITRQDVDHVLISAMEMGAIPVTKIPAVLREWKNPSFDHGNETVWRLFNAFTQVMKGNSLFELPARTQRLHTLLDGLVGFSSFTQVPETSEVVEYAQGEEQ